MLGAKLVKGKVLITCYFPDALKVSVVLTKKKESVPMVKMEEDFFAVLLPYKNIPKYQYHITYSEGSVTMSECFNEAPVITPKDMLQFQNGIHYSIYRKMGSHRMTLNGTEGVLFAVWAPNAISVSVVGDFNFWDGRKNQMRRLGESGIFELFIPDLEEGDIYKYQVRGRQGVVKLKADPYGNYSELRPDTASVIWDIEKYEWNDDIWMAERKKKKFEKEPMVIYEVHLGSFKKDNDDFYNYRELAPLLIEHCRKMNFTHVECMPVMEYPFDASWGYQVTGYYAPTSRYGTPDDFMFFIDSLHEAGIGVILDWVPAHFPKDEHGLARFDGTCLYEHMDPRKGEHPHWGTLIYNYGRPQVSNFLIANALFWLDKYHIDGLRFDAVASMLYLDYGKSDGQWVANMYGGHENLETEEMLKHLNSIVKKRKDGTLMIAEESTSWPKITGDLEDGGLGFDFKWNMGWMNDYLEYIRTDPLFRKGRHGMLTFSMVYHYSENYILVLSHDEVVHGKGSLYQKMPGGEKDKLAGLRLTYGFMAGHPGKVLLFMGQEFGQKSEWNEDTQIDWKLPEEHSSHAKLMTYVKELFKFYKEHTAMYADDYLPKGFEWVSMLDADNSVIAFLRKSAEETLLILCNFTPAAHQKFKVGVPFAGKYKEIFNSDDLRFGGEGMVNPRVKQSKPIKCDGKANSIECRLPGLGMTVFSCTHIPYRPKAR